jgi:uncharacterized protein YlaI
MGNIPTGKDYKYHTYRCNICDRVSKEEISNDPGNFHRGRFREDPDPTRFGYLCDECDGEIEETLEGYGYEEEDDDD